MLPAMTAQRSPVTLALGGMIALAAAMGLGRFLYTPVLPMMVEGTALDPASAGLLASANFAGYLAGALAASLPGLGPRARLWTLAALVASGLTTGAMGIGEDFAVWALLRFAGGVASAFVLVLASSLVVARLRAGGRPDLAALHFAGVGVGIAVSAVISAPVLAPDGAWAGLWLAGGALTLIATFAVAAMVPGRAPAGVGPSPPRPPRAPGLWRLVVAYGCLGFGYVVTATFIVAILREGGGDRTAESWIWGLVGLTAAPSVLFWSRIAGRIGAIRAWQAAMLVEGLGVALSALASGALALGLAAAALGGTFMGLTALGLQEAARRAGGDGRAMMGLMTATFGIGQMIGPGLAGWLREATGGYAAPSLMAAMLLFVGAALVHPLARRRAAAVEAA